MEDDISITHEKHNEYTRCVVKGAALTSSYKTMQECIDKVIEEKVDSKRYLVFDFSEASMISSTCINVINSRTEQLKKSKWELVVISPPDERGEIFELTGFNVIYPVYNSMEAFIAHKGIKE